eukprot:XP_783971.3 PREDICTED: CUB and sushi domain-containing protein 2 [Strongylocentrotus purpuratus]
MRTLMGFCLLVIWLGLVAAKPRPLFLNDGEEKVDWMVEAKSRTRRQSVTSFKEAEQKLRLLRVRMNDIDEDLRPCDEEDVLKGVQCIEEDKCITWDQVCDDVQDCGLQQLGACLNQTVQQYRVEREDLCNGDENRLWCDLKEHIPRRCGEDIDLSERTNKTVRILSPNYPRQYPSDIHCYWMIKTAEGSTLSASFKKFDTEPDYDFFSLGTGEKEDEEDPTKYLIFKHSGPELPDPTSFKIKGDTMWISFRSDDWDNYSGFEVHVADTSVFDPGNVAKSPFPDARNTTCGGTVRLDIDGEETITSPGYPEQYGNYMQCDWLVRIVPGRRIGISFRTFELETNQDFVEIGSGASVGTDLVNGGKLTGHSVPHKAIVIENNVAWIRFTSDPANARRGFSAIVRDQPHNGCGGTIDIPNDGSIVVASPLFPDLGYRVNLNCIWKFTGSEGRTLSVIFKDFATEEKYDTVSAGYGSSPARDGSNYVIKSASGSGLPEPAGFDTPSNEAWIYFRSDSSIIDRGFKVEVSDTSIRPANFTPEVQPTKEPDTNCGGEVVGGSFTTKLVIDSPGGSTYRKFLDCLWEIEIPFGGQIRLFFPQFQTEQYRDIVIVGNGTDTEDNESIFITHSGRKKPKEVLTYANNLWVRFTTDSDYELSGWTMVVEAIPYTNCSGHLSIPPEGSITIGSPNFPYNYNNGETCYYQIIGAPGKRILVNFLEFNTERDFRDVMNIGDGCFLASGDIIVRNHSGHGLPDPGRYFSRQNAVWMTFQTSDFSDYKGWLINFADAKTPADAGAECEVFVPPTQPPATTKEPYQPIIYGADEIWSGLGPIPAWYDDLNPDADGAGDGDTNTMTDFEYSSPVEERVVEGSVPADSA